MGLQGGYGGSLLRPLYFYTCNAASWGLYTDYSPGCVVDLRDYTGTTLGDDSGLWLSFLLVAQRVA